MYECRNRTRVQRSNDRKDVCTIFLGSRRLRSLIRRCVAAASLRQPITFSHQSDYLRRNRYNFFSSSSSSSSSTSSSSSSSSSSSFYSFFHLHLLLLLLLLVKRRNAVFLFRLLRWPSIRSRHSAFFNSFPVVSTH